MIEITLRVSEVDYDALVDVLSPLVAERMSQRGGILRKLMGKESRIGTLAHGILKGKSYREKEALAVELAMKNREMLAEKLTELAHSNGISLQVDSLQIESE